jgi:short-subunit dehydrogenase
MNFDGARVLLTGASAGIDRCLALELSRRGAHLALVARDERRLATVSSEVCAGGGTALAFPFDLAHSDRYPALVSRVVAALGGITVLVNNAGISSFAPFAGETPEAIERLIAVNVSAPLLLTRAVLPYLLRQRAGHIVNVGSIFGSIAFPHFTAYSASKYAMRGFSEALRRELQGTGVRVSYIAPRTTATAMNGAAVRAFMRQTGAAIDTPEAVARIIADAIEREKCETFIGQPERFFVRLNALLPRLVDRALARQKRIAEGLLRTQR